jgi:hypothetical protein
MKNWGSKRIHPELVITLGADAYSQSQIKIWLQKFRNGDLSCKDVSHTGRQSLSLGPQLVAFLQKHPFARARVLAQHFLMSVLTIREMLQRAGIKRFSRRWMPHFRSPFKELLVLKHQQRCHKFHMSWKGIF